MAEISEDFPLLVKLVDEESALGNEANGAIGVIEHQQRELERLQQLVMNWVYGVSGRHRSCDCPYCNALADEGMKLTRSQDTGDDRK